MTMMKWIINAVQLVAPIYSEAVIKCSRGGKWVGSGKNKLVD